MDRREFMQVMTKTLVAFWGLAIMYPVASYLKKPEEAESATAEVVAAKADELAPGDGKPFKFGNQPAMLIRDKNGDYHAYSAICSHLGCTTQFRKEEGDIFCACHGGIYDLSGKNVSGPPPKPLMAFKVTVAGDQIKVSKA